jgi:hypothetical protein
MVQQTIPNKPHLLDVLYEGSCKLTEIGTCHMVGNSQHTQLLTPTHLQKQLCVMYLGHCPCMYDKAAQARADKTTQKKKQKD